MFAAAILAALPGVWLLAVCTPLTFAPHLPALSAALVMIAMAPVLEEIVFRAGLQDSLAAVLPQRLGALSLANVVTAAGFALIHLWQHPPAWALATALPALVFGGLYERHRNLYAPIGLHAVYNAAYLSLLRPG